MHSDRQQYNRIVLIFSSFKIGSGGGEYSNEIHLDLVKKESIFKEVAVP